MQINKNNKKHFDILLSIHPKWAKKIYLGEKEIEWRKSAPKKGYKYDVSGHQVYDRLNVYLYETSPTYKVTGFFYCRYIRRYENDILNQKSFLDLAKGCVPINDLKKYYGDRDLFAWRIDDEVTTFIPRGLKDMKLKKDGVLITRPPQSWCYVDEK